MKRQWYSTTAGIPGLASSEQARRVIDWTRERTGAMVELKDCQQQEIKGKLQLHSHLTFTACTFASLKVCNLKVAMYRTYCVSLRGPWSL